MDKQVLLEKLEEFGVLQIGHFLLSSGLHSDKYLQCAKILQYPEWAGKLGGAVGQLFSENQIDVVVGPAMGGVILAHEVGRSLGCRSIFSERKEGVMQFSRGFEIKSGENVLVVEDVVTTGKSASEVLEIIPRGANILGIGAIIDRSFGEVDFPVPFKALLPLEVEVYSPQSCPLCEKGIPFVKPGSRESRN